MNLQAFSIDDVARETGGTVHGGSQKMLSGISPLETATANDLSFFAPKTKVASQDLLRAAQAGKAGALLVARYDESIPCPQIVVSNPLAAVIALSEKLYTPPRPASGIDALASVSKSAKIGKNVAVGPFAVISDNVSIGDNTVIFSHVVIYPNAIIGKNCILHAGAVVREYCRLGDDCQIQNGVVVGGDGFGYMPVPKVGHRRIPHIGAVNLASGVDMGANSTVDRGMLGDTKVGAGTKIDNLVMVGHNVQIGERVLLCAQTGISGSTTIGDDTVLGGSVGVADHVHIGKGVRAAARSGITGSVEDNTDVAGYPHQEASLWRRSQVIIRRLPQLLASLHDLESRMKSVEEKLETTDARDGTKRERHENLS